MITYINVEGFFAFRISFMTHVCSQDVIIEDFRAMACVHLGRDPVDLKGVSDGKVKVELRGDTSTLCCSQLVFTYLCVQFSRRSCWQGCCAAFWCCMQGICSPGCFCSAEKVEKLLLSGK